MKGLLARLPRPAVRSHGRPQPEVRAALPWLLLSLLLAIAPALLQLPAWVAPLALIPLALKAWAWRCERAVGPVWWGGLLVLSLLALATGFRELGSERLVLAGFALVLALKGLETQARRDAHVLLFGACVLTALAAARYPNAIALALILLLSPALLVALAALAGAPRPLRQAGVLLGLALPPALALFLLVPRIPGPLWDFGLALGLPIGVTLELGSGALGKETSFTPGAPRGGGGGDGTALVAEFDGYVPPTSRLYWRGPVLYRFDGREWHAAEGFGNRNRMLADAFRKREDWEAEWRSSGQALAYKVRLAPHGRNWLYALDLPAGPTAESYITRDYQLLSMTPIREESHYRAVAQLDGRIGRALDEERRAEALQLPPGQNPRLIELGKRIAADNTDPRARAVAAFDFFIAGGFRYNDRISSPAVPQPYDAFLFDTREGGSDMLAASYVLLARAAGVPARLIAGYRGGRLMALTDFVLVKESNAHAWAEVWLEEDGWVRFDPTDAVAPQRFADKRAARTSAQSAPSPTRASAGSSREAATQSMATAVSPAKDDPAPLAPARGEDWLGALDKWVIRYDASRQSELLGRDEGFGGGWALLGGGLVASLTLFAALYTGIARGLAWRSEDPLARAWLRICRQLERGGHPVASTQCPQALADRLATDPGTEFAAELARRYARLRYGHPAPGEADAFARAAYHFRFTPGQDAR